MEKRLHSIYLSRGKFFNNKNLPYQINQNILSFKSHHHDYKHVLYDDDSLRNFIELHFDSEVLDSYDKLIPLAYKADLGRYCLLFEYGGIYADLAIYFFQRFYNDKNIHKLHIFRDAFSEVPWITSNSIIAAPSKLKIFEILIHKIIQNCREEHYGVNALSPTGPNIFGSILAAHLDPKIIICGDTNRINKNRHHSYAYTSPEGDVVAVSVKKGTGLSSLGHNIDENYNQYWSAKNVYGELAGKLIWNYSQFLFNSNSNLVSINKNIFEIYSEGYIESPYFTLAKGGYFAKLNFRIIKPMFVKSSIVIELISGNDQKVIYKSKIMKIEKEILNATISINFKVEKMNPNMKIRITSMEPVIFNLDNLTIHK
jgi:mannosyltransferase OCH1-like enzyme